MTTTSDISLERFMLNIEKEIDIQAPADIVFAAILEQSALQPGGDSKPMGLKLEPWVGGRWYRDTGNNTGHLWGFVQVIKPAKVLEITGPMMMSYPATNHVQYRLVQSGDMTRLLFKHRAFGLIEAEHREGVNRGWQVFIEGVRDLAMKQPRT